MPTASYDIKTDYRTLYAPKGNDFVVVDVPEFSYLMVDGHGDPNTAGAYREAVEALYTVAYGCRAIAKASLGRVHTVGPLEGLWWAEDLGAFTARDKSSWNWTMMIVQPEWVTARIVDDAIRGAAKKQLPALPLVRFEALDEGRCVQVLHVGSYDDEAPVLARLHDEYLPTAGLTERGHHHEIYLSDPRKTEPARLKTILRQPVS